MKKQTITFFLAIIAIFLIDPAFAAGLPSPEKVGLPFENRQGAGVGTGIARIIKEVIKYIGLFAILALTYGGILTVLSYGEEEKLKSAKKILMYSVVGIVLSGAAYAIIDLVNSLKL